MCNPITEGAPVLHEWTVKWISHSVDKDDINLAYNTCSTVLSVTGGIEMIKIDRKEMLLTENGKNTSSTQATPNAASQLLST